MSPPRIQPRQVFIPQADTSTRPSTAESKKPAPRRTDTDTFEPAQKKAPVALAGGTPASAQEPSPGTGDVAAGAAAAGAAAAAGVEGAAATAAVAGVHGIDPKVLDTQEKLSTARQKLGEYKLSGGKDESTLKQLENEVAELEKQEEVQFKNPDLKDDVEKAQFVVLEKRMGELEKQYGKHKAATLARQTYYNSDLWNLAGGSAKASDDQVLALGLPHTPGQKNSDVAVGGYAGQMRTPDGQPVDMGHVLCGMDWQLNKDRVPKTLSVDDLAKAVGKEKLGDIIKSLPGGEPDIPNPFTKGFVTLTGDIGSAVAARYNGTSADDAIKNESDYDWNGDLDGLNLAKRLADNPNQSITDAMKSYYGSGEYKNRVDEYATHGGFVKRDGNGQPIKDKNGHYELDTKAIANAGVVTGILLSKGGIADDVLKEGLNPFSDEDKAKEVAEAFERWLHRAQDAS
ncbi:hypothetical protein [Archangium lipolyticum]|uniref:hypothetical protein n=1 Tax=Archangium lipolyticum TaxID=2970465 RepID=UPI00214A521C|nr:hypothetical protein [Archangium lipolyticum]